jgi:hypothetical protein
VVFFLRGRTPHQSEAGIAVQIGMKVSLSRPAVRIAGKLTGSLIGASCSRMTVFCKCLRSYGGMLTSTRGKYVPSMFVDGIKT